VQGGCSAVSVDLPELVGGAYKLGFFVVGEVAEIEDSERSKVT